MIHEQENISAEVKELVCSLVKKSPHERPSATEALKHCWFDKQDWESATLGSTQEKLAERKMLKENKPEDFLSSENFSMA